MNTQESNPVDYDRKVKSVLSALEARGVPSASIAAGATTAQGMRTRETPASEGERQARSGRAGAPLAAPQTFFCKPLALLWGDG